MSGIINTYSSSFKYDLEKSFFLDDANIQKFLSNDLPVVFNKANDIIDNINKYKSLKTFLGKKRNRILNEEDFYNNQIHFKSSVTSKNVNGLSINSGINGEFYIDNNVNNHNVRLYIYEKPMLLLQLFDCQTINIDFISDNITLRAKMNDLNEFNFKIYSCKGEKNNLNISTELELPKNKDNSINIGNENLYPYLLIIHSKINKVSLSDLTYDKIYKTNDKNSNLISPKEISDIFFYYFSISDQLQKKYYYIESDYRRKLYQILSRFLQCSRKNITIIVGPKGIGKTTSLVKFSFEKEFRVFYFNLEVFQLNAIDSRKKELKIQIIKLFGDTPLNKDDNDIKQKMEKYIEDNSHKNSLEFIYNIIDIFKDFTKYEAGIDFGFIIDQYSLNNNTNRDKEYNIDKIISLVSGIKQIKLILCPTINNDFSKEQINSIFENIFNPENNKIFDVYYFQEFISEKQFLDNILIDQNDKYKDYIDELGYSPKHYYELNNININMYKEYLINNLNKNLKKYYLSNNKSDENIDINIEKLNLLDIVKGEKLISSSELINKISKLPLNYLKITKFKINDEIINEISTKFNEYSQEQNDKIKKKEKDEEDILIKYLKLLWNNEINNKYDNIIENKFFIEEKNIFDFIDSYIEKDKSSTNIYGNYYQSFINSYNNGFDPFVHKYDYIFVYKLDFSINMIENILLEHLCEHLKKENKLLSNILDKGACGGIFELLVGYYIQKSGLFLGEQIEQTIYISSLVPNNYSISYYSSYKKEKRKFQEFKLSENNYKKRKEINFKNTFIKQVFFNSKYYDFAILIKLNKKNTYKLIVIQVTIKKDKEKRMTKEEHELILRAVKLNIENEFNISIEEGYFIYILSQKNGEIEDQETKKDCDNNKIEYIGFDINTFDNYKNEYKINTKNAFITNTFPVHNSASLLSISKKNMSDESDYSKIKAIIDEKIKSKEILKQYIEYINKLFKNKYDDLQFSPEQFSYFEIKYSLFEKNKVILNYLSNFSFLLFIGKNEKKIYVHFNKSTYDCKNNNKISFKPTKGDVDKIYFCFSLVPLSINYSPKKDN